MAPVPFPAPVCALECLAAVSGGRPGWEVPGGGEAYFPQSVASGDPRADGVVLWTRAVDPARPGAPLTLGLQVARDARFRDCVLEAEGLRTTCARDHTLKVRVTGLAPRTHYHYRFVLEPRGARLGSPVGRTRTAAASPLGLPVHFVVASYEELLGQERAAWQRLLQREEDPDFILFAAGAPPEAGEPGRVHSVSSYRDLYRTYRSHPFLRQVHARYPFVVLGEPESREPEAGASPAWRALSEYLPSEAWEGPPPPRAVAPPRGALARGTRWAPGGRSPGIGALRAGRG